MMIKNVFFLSGFLAVFNAYAEAPAPISEACEILQKAQIEEIETKFHVDDQRRLLGALLAKLTADRVAHLNQLIAKKRKIDDAIADKTDKEPLSASGAVHKIYRLAKDSHEKANQDAEINRIYLEAAREAGVIDASAAKEAELSDLVVLKSGQFTLYLKGTDGIKLSLNSGGNPFQDVFTSAHPPDSKLSTGVGTLSRYLRRYDAVSLDRYVRERNLPPSCREQPTASIPEKASSDVRDAKPPEPQKGGAPADENGSPSTSGVGK